MNELSDSNTMVKQPLVALDVYCVISQVLSSLIVPKIGEEDESPLKMTKKSSNPPSILIVVKSNWI